jgi:hypothetical protein
MMNAVGESSPDITLHREVTNSLMKQTVDSYSTKNEFSAFLESETSSLCSRKVAIQSYNELAHSHPHLYLQSIQYNILLSFVCHDFTRDSYCVCISLFAYN